MPPRLVVERVGFEPPLPDPLAHAWADCPTWMAPHAKYVAVYPRPFWRAQGLSGSARSYAGPMVEIHDASPADEGMGALFGPRRPPKVPHLWPPKLLHPARGDLMH